MKEQNLTVVIVFFSVFSSRN